MVGELAAEVKEFKTLPFILMLVIEHLLTHPGCSKCAWYSGSYKPVVLPWNFSSNRKRSSTRTETGVLISVSTSRFLHSILTCSTYLKGCSLSTLLWRTIWILLLEHIILLSVLFNCPFRFLAFIIACASSSLSQKSVGISNHRTTPEHS